MGMSSVDRHKTEYDDVLYIVGVDKSEPGVNWQVIKGSDEEIKDEGRIFFWIEYFDTREQRYLRTKYPVSTMDFVRSYYTVYKFIRSEKEYFEWCIKYGN
jgi:hypothetical protein